MTIEDAINMLNVIIETNDSNSLFDSPIGDCGG